MKKDEHGLVKPETVAGDGVLGLVAGAFIMDMVDGGMGRSKGPKGDTETHLSFCRLGQLLQPCMPEAKGPNTLQTPRPS